MTVEDGRLRIHAVEPARTLPDGILVRADACPLKPGDRLVTTSLANPLEGTRVREAAPAASRAATAEQGP